MGTEGLKYWAERVADVVAEDMVELLLNAKFEASQFPVPATVLIDSLPRDTLVKIAKHLRENLYPLNIPLGFYLLFLMPRKIPEDVKKPAFKEVVEKLHSIRADFSLRDNVEIKVLNHDLPDVWENISLAGYKKALFLLENLNELRVPVFRGWGFDVFCWDGYLYRAYNLGTLRRPKWVYFRAEAVKQPRLNVFGHVREAEDVKKVYVSGSFDFEEVVGRLKAEQERAANLHSLDDKLDFVLSQWEDFLGVEIQRVFDEVPEKKPAGLPKHDEKFVERLRDGTRECILKLLS